MTSGEVTVDLDENPSTITDTVTVTEDVPRNSRPEPRWLTALPILLVLLVATLLTGANLNGSSVHQLDTTGEDPALVLGHSQEIRADEWSLSTPNLVGNVRRGMPAQTWIGLTSTFLPATSIGVPSAHWTEVFKPYDWGFFLLPVDRGFAWRWWGLLVLGLLGVYPLLWQLSRSMFLAGGLAAVTVLAPVTAWWSLTPAIVMGTLAGAGACLIAAARSRNFLTTALWGLGAGYLGVAGFLILYPPWLISIGLVVVAVVIGRWLDLRARPSRIVVAGAGALVVALPALLLWYAQSAPSIRAISGTTYPGNRISPAGGARLSWFLDTPSSLWLSLVRPHSTLWAGPPRKTLLWQNQSEISSGWFPLPVTVVVILALCWIAFRSFRSRSVTTTDATATDGKAPAGSTRSRLGTPSRPFWTVSLTILATGTILAWALLPLPDLLGQITLLNRVPSRRVPVALGLAGAVILLGGGMLLRGRPVPRWLTTTFWLGGLGTVAVTEWAVFALDWESRPPTAGTVAVVAAFFGLGAVLVASGRLMRFGSALLAGLAILSFAPVNPLCQGLGPLENDPVVRTLLEYQEENGPVRVAVYGGRGLNALVTSSGATVLSGLTVYPDSQVWSQFVPDREKRWNKYAKYTWQATPGSGEIQITESHITFVTLSVDPCSPDAEWLDIQLSVSETKIDATCLALVGTTTYDGSPIYLYRQAS